MLNKRKYVAYVLLVGLIALLICAVVLLPRIQHGAYAPSFSKLDVKLVMLQYRDTESENPLPMLLTDQERITSLCALLDSSIGERDERTYYKAEFGEGPFISLYLICSSGEQVELCWDYPGYIMILGYEDEKDTANDIVKQRSLYHSTLSCGELYEYVSAMELETSMDLQKILCADVNSIIISERHSGADQPSVELRELQCKELLRLLETLSQEEYKIGSWSGAIEPKLNMNTFCCDILLSSENADNKITIASFETTQGSYTSLFCDSSLFSVETGNFLYDGKALFVFSPQASDLTELLSSWLSN